jgi:post-segregation antitoxin (ccd killing protein)
MPQSSKVLRELKNIILQLDPCVDAKNPGNNVSPAVDSRIWAAENAEFIAEYNKRVEAEGTLLQEWCTF